MKSILKGIKNIILLPFSIVAVVFMLASGVLLCVLLCAAVIIVGVVFVVLAALGSSLFVLNLPGIGLVIQAYEEHEARQLREREKLAEKEDSDDN